MAHSFIELHNLCHSKVVIHEVEKVTYLKKPKRNIRTKLCQISLRGKFVKLYLAEENISYPDGKASMKLQNAPLRVKDMENTEGSKVM